MGENRNKPVLLILAAGLGSRYKGLKQIEAVDDMGHILMDYSIYDAIEAGFGEIVFVIRRDFEDRFREVIGDRISKKIKVSYVFQSMDDYPGTIDYPEGRVKPWGTTHAIWSAREVLKGKAFLTINADDFYGRGAFEAASEFLSRAGESDSHACICYNLLKTLSKTGSVNRGVCQVNEESNLIHVDEKKNIVYRDGHACILADGDNADEVFPDDAMASMNLWAFSEGFIDDLETSFEKRFVEGVQNNPEKFEETISDAVQDMLDRGIGRVRCILTDETWFGMTYVEELEQVKQRLKELREEGVYVEEKW